MHPDEALFNPRFSTQPENCTDLDALRAAWRSLSTAESASTPGQRLGIARRRTELLSAFPVWQIPEIIDVLNRPECEVNS